MQRSDFRVPNFGLADESGRLASDGDASSSEARDEMGDAAHRLHTDVVKTLLGKALVLMGSMVGRTFLCLEGVIVK